MQALSKHLGVQNTYIIQQLHRVNKNYEKKSTSVEYH